MRLDGALEPRQGAGPLPGRSIGVATLRRATHEQCESKTKQQQCADEDDDAAAATTTKAAAVCLSNSNNNALNNSCRRPQQQPQQLWRQQANKGALQSRASHNDNNNKVALDLKRGTTTTRTATANWCAISWRGNAKGAIVASLKMRAQQSLMLMAASVAVAVAAAVAVTVTGRRFNMFALCLITVAALTLTLPPPTRADDGDNFFAVNSFSMGPETTTPEFDYASRGQKKYGDKCDNTLECGFPGSICDPKKKSCQCTEDLPVTNHYDKCGKEAAVNESCFFNEQCEVKYFQTECRDGRCICRFEMSPIWAKDGTVECKGRQDKRGPETYIDPAMIGVLVGMALMFIIICVVLRLFSQARWHDNRTIFNTPNPRLMNVSLLRDSKLLHGQERRGSRMSVRAPSRQPSMASLRPHSPNPSLGRMIRSKSNTRSSDSRVSDVSTCSRLLEHPNAATQHNAVHSHFLPYVPTTTAAAAAASVAATTTITTNAASF